MNIRIYKKQDGELLQGASIASKYRLFVNGWMMGEYLRDIKYGHDDDIEAIIIALMPDKPIASALILNLKDCQFQIFVREKYRRQGIGSKMFNYGMVCMNRTEPFKMWTDHSSKAENFYLKNCKTCLYSINKNNDKWENIDVSLEKTVLS